MKMNIILCLTLLTFLSHGESKNLTKNLYIGGLFSVTGLGWTGGIYTLPGVQYAIELVNSRTDILPNYNLVLLWNDTEGSATVGMKKFFDMLYTGPTKVMLIGPVRSRVAVPVAESAAGWNLIQMSFGPRTPDMSDKTRFPYFFRTIGPDEVFNAVKVALFKRFGWTRVACLYEFHSADIYSAATTDFVAMWQSNNYTVVAAESLAHPGTALDALKKLDARIIVANMFFTTARKVFCEAYRRGMYGRKYVWVLLGWIAFSWWRIPTPTVNCTQEQLKETAQGLIYTDFLYSESGEGLQEAFGVSSEEFKSHILRSIPRFSFYSAYAFDGMMALALTLHQAAEEGLPLEDFSYENATYSEKFVRILSTLSFDGLTGPVAFDNKGNRIGISSISQNQDGVEKRVGKYYPLEDRLEMDEVDSLIWPGEVVPRDGFIKRKEKKYIPHVAFFAFTTIGIAGVLLCAVFLFFNVKHKELRYIKLSSPTMNNVILLGCTLAYIALILYGLDRRFLTPREFSVVCNVRTSLLSVAFTIAFGAIFSKTWRVHQIMANRSAARIVVKDRHLVSSVLALLGVDAVIFIAWFVMDPQDLNIIKLQKVVDVNDEDFLIEPELEVCSCKHEGYWTAALLVYKGLLLLSGLIVAWETRNIQVEALNDSRYICITVYNIATVCLIGVPVNFLIGEEDYVSSYIITSLSLILCTTVTVCIVFLPKVYTIWKVPSGNVTINRLTTKTRQVTPLQDLTDKICVQRRLEALLKEKDDRIRSLEAEKYKSSSSVSTMRSTSAVFVSETSKELSKH